MALRRAALAALAAILCLLAAVGTVSGRDVLKATAAKGGPHFSYDSDGEDWPHHFPQCGGHLQSPIRLPGPRDPDFIFGIHLLRNADAVKPQAYDPLPPGSTVLNNGHTVQVSFPAGHQSRVLLPFKGEQAIAMATSVIDDFLDDDVTGHVMLQPLQLHFHAHAEHIIGRSAEPAPMELHIVHIVKGDQLPACGSSGCLVVLGVMLELIDDEAWVPEGLKHIFDVMPQGEGETAELAGAVDIMRLLPLDKSFLSYKGSLTAPPCSEGVLWINFLWPVFITPQMLDRFKAATPGGHNFREPQDVAGRLVFAHLPYKSAGPIKPAL